MSPDAEHLYLQTRAHRLTLRILLKARMGLLTILVFALSALLALIVLNHPAINSAACYTVYGLSPDVDLHATSSFTCERHSNPDLFAPNFDIDHAKKAGRDLPHGHGLETFDALVNPALQAQ